MASAYVGSTFIPPLFGLLGNAVSFFHPAGLFAGVCCPDDYDGRDNIPHHPQGKSCKNVTDVYDRNQRVIHNQFKEEEKWQRIRDLKRFIPRER